MLLYSLCVATVHSTVGGSTIQLTYIGLLRGYHTAYVWRLYTVLWKPPPFNSHRISDIKPRREHFFSHHTAFLGQECILGNTFWFYLPIFFSPLDVLLPISACTLTLAEDPHSPDTHKVKQET